MKIAHRALGRVKQILCFFEIVMHQMRNHFGIGLRIEVITRALQTFALFFVIFDNAVMYDGDFFV